MKYLALLTVLCFGCAYGRASGPAGCFVSGFVVGRAKIHATCVPAKKVETPVAEYPKIMPITDDGTQSNILRASNEEAYVEIAGAPPTTSFWTTVFDFVVLAGTAAIAYFKVGG